MPSQTRPAALRVLFIEDDENDALLLARYLKAQGYLLDSRRVSRLDDLRAALLSGAWDVVIADYVLPGFTAVEALALTQEVQEELPFIVVSGNMDEATACAMMHAGTQDYLHKDRLDRLAPVIERERREARIRHERHAAREAARVSEERFHLLAANVPGVLFQLHPEADGGLYFSYISEACRMLLGVDAFSLLDTPHTLQQMIVEDDCERFLHTLQQAAERHATLNWEGRILLPAGESKWVNLRCSPRRDISGTQLWEGVMWNITHSKKTEEELIASRAQLAELSEHLQRAKEEERDRIARDIHDVLNGTLVGIKISVKQLANKHATDGPLQTKVRFIEHMLDEAIATTGRVARELRPGILKEFGLAAAIESYAEDYMHIAGIPCAVLCADHDIEAEEDTALALFRTCQQALTNVSKHARASRIEVRLTQEYDELVLEVSDDGCGLTLADLNKPKSFGLRGIRERLKVLGGSMELRSRQPQGTSVILRAPTGIRR
ncbi:MAG: histidine kinase [Candidatus Dactylopiibacterium carminicum]|nr:MAG: histidine kinase [Candidatus Dactylopiibacterium carminicum]